MFMWFFFIYIQKEEPMTEGNLNIWNWSLHCFTLLCNLHLFQVISYRNLGHSLSHYSTVHSVVRESTIYNLNRPLCNVLTTSPFPQKSELCRGEYICSHMRAKPYPHTHVLHSEKPKSTTMKVSNLPIPEFL